MAREFTSIGVVGLGTMGAGIAEVFARHGFAVVGVERDDDALTVGQDHLRRSTDRAVERGKLSADDQRALLGRVTFTTDLADLAGADLVIEAIPERLDLKRELFARLDAIVAPEAVLATNTSSLSVTEIGVATQHPERVVGLHFFNPAPVQTLVEIVRTVVTDAAVVDDLGALALQLGKAPVHCGDQAGFLANALLFGYLNQAATMYGSGVASRADIDAAMTRGCGYPMGPLALLDLIGLDTAHEILETMYRQSRNRRHAPAPVLTNLVSAGLFGRKSGRGFYAYDDGEREVVPETAVTPTARPARPVRRVGVVGLGAVAETIAEWISGGGLEVRQVGGSAGLAGLADVDLVIDASGGDRAATTALFAALDEICAPGAILATTTSTFPVIDVAAATSRPADVVGLHVVSAATGGTDLVEVARTVATADEVVATLVGLVDERGAYPVTCADHAGFVVNALLFPYLNDAVAMRAAHYASADDIDTAMTLGCRLPSGPFELLDTIGLDVALAIQHSIYDETREPSLTPAPMLAHLVTAGHLGRKTGRGFRDSSSG